MTSVRRLFGKFSFLVSVIDEQRNLKNFKVSCKYTCIYSVRDGEVCRSKYLV